MRSQSATTLGSAQAGMTTGVDDVSTMFFNPAALALGSGRTVAIDAAGIFTSGHFSGSASNLFGEPVVGSNGGDFGTQALVPSLYAATDLAPGVRLGLSIASLYGLGAFWNDGWVGRYYALNSQIFEQDITPTLAYRINPRLSIGAGLDVQHIVLKVTNAIDLHTLDQAGLDGALGIPAGTDGSSRIRTSSWNVGYTLGLLAEPFDGTFIGLSYRSPIHQQSKGQASFDLNAALSPTLEGITGAFTATAARVLLHLPPSVTLGLRHEFGNGWTAMADLQWLGWHSSQSLDVVFANPNQPAVMVPLNWHNSWFATIGAKYQVNPQVAVRFGAAYDQTPTSADTRIPGIPDGDSFWTSIGLEYHATPRLKIDVAYGHIIVTRGSVALSAQTAANTLRGNLTGAIRGGNIDYLATQVSLNF